MSCLSATSPINIDTTTKVETCNIYCAYNFNYNDSTCVITNKGNYLEIKYDLNNNPLTSQAYLSDQPYNISSIQIYQPSIHTYNGEQADAEILIVHNGLGKNVLVVSVPLVVNVAGAANSGGNILDSIILQYARQVDPSSPSDVQSINVTNFNMNSFVPPTPFYYYVGKSFSSQSGSGVLTCDKDINYIVYDKIKSALSISSSTLSSLKNLITKSNVPITNNVYYFNDKGANKDVSKVGDDEIYIDCRPTGEDGKILYQMKPETGIKGDIPGGGVTEKVLGSGLFQFVIAFAIGIVVVKVGKRIFKKD